MAYSLFHAYLPLFFWSGLGIVLFRFLPKNFPRFLGRSLYWVGVPLEIFSLARQTQFSVQVGLAPVVTIAALLSGLGLAWLTLQGVKRRSDDDAMGDRSVGDHFVGDRSAGDDATNPQSSSLADSFGTAPLGTEPSISDPQVASWQNPSRQGSFLLSSMLGNTGFVGLAVAPAFINPAEVRWLVLYSVTQNVIGTYGIGVLLGSYFGRRSRQNHGWQQIWDILTVPSLWAFVLGCLTQPIAFPPLVESGLHASLWFIIPAALLLMGMRLSQLQGWSSLRLAIAPTLLKSLVLPALVGLVAMGLNLPPDPKLALVLMAGMPTAFAGLILAEEYDLDRELIASSIVLTTAVLIVSIPLWLFLFGEGLPGL